MIKKIKDLTREELKRYLNSHDYVSSFKDYEKLVESIFMLEDRYFWGTPMLSDEFLNTIVYIPQPHILDKEEHDYLRAVCKPYKVEYIRKTETLSGKQYIQIVINSSLYFGSIASWIMPYFTKDTMYKGMEVDKDYTIEELELDREWRN